MIIVKYLNNKIIFFLNKNIKIRLWIIKIAKKFGFYNRLKYFSKKLSQFSSVSNKKNTTSLDVSGSILSPHAKKIYLLLRKNTGV